MRYGTGTEGIGRGRRTVPGTSAPAGRRGGGPIGHERCDRTARSGPRSRSASAGHRASPAAGRRSGPDAGPPASPARAAAGPLDPSAFPRGGSGGRRLGGTRSGGMPAGRSLNLPIRVVGPAAAPPGAGGSLWKRLWKRFQIRLPAPPGQGPSCERCRAGGVRRGELPVKGSRRRYARRRRPLGRSPSRRRRVVARSARTPSPGPAGPGPRRRGSRRSWSPCLESVKDGALCAGIRHMYSAMCH